MLLNDYETQSNMECTGTTNSICYLLGLQNGFYYVSIIRVDFSDLTAQNFADYSSGVHLSSVNAINENETIIAGFDINPAQHAHTFFRINMTGATHVWGVTAAPLGK